MANNKLKVLTNLVNTRKVLKDKLNELKVDEIDREHFLDSTFKPISKPLNQLVEKLNTNKTNNIHVSDDDDDDDELNERLFKIRNFNKNHSTKSSKRNISDQENMDSAMILISKRNVSDHENMDIDMNLMDINNVDEDIKKDFKANHLGSNSKKLNAGKQRITKQVIKKHTKRHRLGTDFKQHIKELQKKQRLSKKDLNNNNKYADEIKSHENLSNIDKAFGSSNNYLALPVPTSTNLLYIDDDDDGIRLRKIIKRSNKADDNVEKSSRKKLKFVKLRPTIAEKFRESVPSNKFVRPHLRSIEGPQKEYTLISPITKTSPINIENETTVNLRPNNVEKFLKKIKNVTNFKKKKLINKINPIYKPLLSNENKKKIVTTNLSTNGDDEVIPQHADSIDRENELLRSIENKPDLWTKHKHFKRKAKSQLNRDYKHQRRWNVQDEEEEEEEVYDPPNKSEYDAAYAKINIYNNIRLLMESKNLDKLYGFNVDSRGRWRFGKNVMKIQHKNTFVVGKNKWFMTPGLFALVFHNNPTYYTKRDLDKYRDILLTKNVHKRDFNSENQIKGTKSFKYRAIIRKIFNISKDIRRGGSLKQLNLSIINLIMCTGMILMN